MSEVLLDGGPWDGQLRELTERQEEQAWLAVPVGRAEPVISTPCFDAAFGLPTPEPCKGFYRAYVAGDSKWHWFPSPESRPRVSSLPYIGFYQ